MSDHRHVAVKDRRVEPTDPGRRALRRAGDDEPPATQPSVRRPRGGKRKSAISAGGWVSIVMTGVLVVGTLAGYKFYRDIEGNIKRQDVEKDLGANRPPETGALNVLLVGSDSREGDANKRYGQHMQGQGERTDTIILLHVSPNRDKVTLVSFPRDSMVQAPECKNPKTGAIIPAGLKQINSTFNDGGIACTWKTIETLTQIHINHFVKVDFAGFKGIVDALGGVEICLPKDVYDKKAKLDLKKGKQIVKGETALAYVRARYALGDGSDTDRIKRQQVFMTQVMKQATSSSLLTDLGKLNDFLKAATASVTMDRNLDTGRILEIARSAGSLTEKSMTSVTVPWKPYEPKPAQVEWKQPEANELFEAIRTDVEVTPAPKASASAPARPTVKNEQVRVQVINGTGKPGLATEVAGKLAAQGFVVTHVGNASAAGGGPVPATSVRYAKKDATDGTVHADTLTARLSGERLTPAAGKTKPSDITPYPAAPATASTLTGPVVQLVIGADWKGVRVPSIPTSLKDKVIDHTTNPCQ
ncbi:LCP family protein [Planobispora siamensis]|uniref:Cell envelope-related function transcriptional attenuator common domain-containing protein n=1 Tax=Planobispora siamensis TaxID=936338 RepID=A0A8J3WIF8_9ACTN|nr:LCP family protein [Planobispora siamensis]GIH89687.1 hypothetical protein Psi01_03170 [Planobispora siamensis]